MTMSKRWYNNNYFVLGPIIEIKNSSEGFVYSAGSHIALQCVYRNKTKKEWEVSYR